MFFFYESFALFAEEKTLYLLVHKKMPTSIDKNDNFHREFPLREKIGTLISFKNIIFLIYNYL